MIASLLENTSEPVVRQIDNAMEAPTPTVVYADSIGALEAAWESGLPRNVKVRSPAPALLANPSLEAEVAEELLSPDRIKKLESAILTAALGANAELRSDRSLEQAEDVGLVASRVVTTDFQDVLRSAALLRESDFQDRPVVVTFESEGGPPPPPPDF